MSSRNGLFRFPEKRKSTRPGAIKRRNGRPEPSKREFSSVQKKKIYKSRTRTVLPIVRGRRRQLRRGSRALPALVCDRYRGSGAENRRPVFCGFPSPSRAGAPPGPSRPIRFRRVIARAGARKWPPQAAVIRKTSAGTHRRPNQDRDGLTFCRRFPSTSPPPTRGTPS